MALMEYSLRSYQESYISEPKENNPWPNQRKNPHPPNLSLEEEIHILRTRMEKTIKNENSLTSEIVIQISRLLDEKINEYMRGNRKG